MRDVRSGGTHLGWCFTPFFYFLPLDDRKYCNIHIYFTRQSETKLRWMYFAFLRNLRAWKTLKTKYIIRYFESKNSFPSLENPIHLNWSMLSFDKGFGIGRAVFYLLPRSKQKGVFQWIWMKPIHSKDCRYWIKLAQLTTLSVSAYSGTLSSKLESL